MQAQKFPQERQVFPINDLPQFKRYRKRKIQNINIKMRKNKIETKE